MDLKYIEGFLSVVEEGSFSAASQKLYITQPTLTNRIQKLETLLNVKVFMRGNGEKAVLTDDGKKVLAYYKRGYELIREGTDLFSLHVKKKSQLVISSPNHLGENIVSGIVETIRKVHPDIDFLLEINESPITLDQISKNETDIGFVYTTSNKDFENINGVEIHQITSEDIVLVCAPEHPLTRLKKVSVHHLKGEHIIRTNRTFKSSKEVDKYFHKHGINGYKTIEIKNIEWLKSMVKNQSGISFLLRNIVSNELKRGELVEIPLNHNLPRMPVALVFRQNLNMNIKKQVLRTARKLFQESSWKVTGTK